MIGLLLAAALATSPPIRPDPVLTPGAVNPAATAQVICLRGYTGQKGVRHVTTSTKRKVFAEYGINSKVGGPYEVDHLISLELGGSNALANLWPQSYVTTPWNARLKDRLENDLHRRVCLPPGDPDHLDLSDAQKAIGSDWIAAFNEAFATLPQ